MNSPFLISEYPVDPKKLRVHNFKKYKGIPPSWSLIQSVLQESGIRFMYKFELVFGIPQQSLKLYKNGHRGLPATYWHIFYDFEVVKNKFYKLYKSRKVTKPTSKSDAVLGTNKYVINDIKQQLQFAGR